MSNSMYSFIFFFCILIENQLVANAVGSVTSPIIDNVNSVI